MKKQVFENQKQTIITPELQTITLNHSLNEPYCFNKSKVSYTPINKTHFKENKELYDGCYLLVNSPFFNKIYNHLGVFTNSYIIVYVMQLGNDDKLDYEILSDKYALKKDIYPLTDDIDVLGVINSITTDYHTPIF